MNILIKPSVLRGKIDIPASKSVAHRLLICASLAGNSEVNNINFSKDIEATIQAMSSLGSVIYTNENSADIPDSVIRLIIKFDKIRIFLYIFKVNFIFSKCWNFFAFGECPFADI